MYLRDLAKVAIENGEGKTKVTSTLSPLHRTFLGILERRHNIRRVMPSSQTDWRGGIIKEDTRKWNELARQTRQGQPGITVEELLEEYPDALERTRIQEFGPGKEKYFTYLLEKYYQPNQPDQTVYERRDTYGGEYDI